MRTDYLDVRWQFVQALQPPCEIKICLVELTGPRLAREQWAYFPAAGSSCAMTGSAGVPNSQR